MARAKPGQVQNRHTLLGAEDLCSRVNLKKESIQCKVMTTVISSVKRLARIRTKLHQIVSPGM